MLITKRLIVTFFCTFSLFASFICAEESEGKEFPLPHPLELKKNWWGYFDVPPEKLNSRIQEFKDEINQLKSTLNEEEHKEFPKMLDQIYLMLELYAQKKAEVRPTSSPKLQLRKAYTLEQLIGVHENLQRAILEIDARRNKIKILQSRMNRLQSTLDRSIILYQNSSPATYEKLKQGILIIVQRIELALQDLELQRDKESLNHFVKERDLFREELTAAKGRLFIDAEVIDSLKQKKEETVHAYIEARDKLYQLEKEANLIDQQGEEDEFTCCLGDNQVLLQSIVVENYTLKLLINEIKQVLATLKLNHQEAESDNIQEMLADWTRQLDSAEEQHDFWNTQIKDDQAQVSRMTAQSIQEEDVDQVDQVDLIGDIHFELDKSLAELELLKIHIENGEFLSHLVEDQLVEKKSFMQTWLISLNSIWYKFKGFVDYWTHVTLFRIKEQPVTLMTFINAILIFFGGLLFSHYLRKFLVKRKIVQRSFSYSTEYIVLRLIHYSIIIIALLIALSFIGLDFTNLAIVAGALGVGIGFGLQTIVSNISSGFMLLLKKYLKVGDVIELSDKQLGTITAVNLQNTIIRTFDGAEVMMPNSQLSSQRLTNWTMRDNCRRFRIPFGVAYGTDKNLVRDSVIDAIKKLPFVYSDDFRYPDPQVWLVEFGDSSINFELVAWVDLSVPVPYETSRSALMWELDTTLKENGIEIPFPQRDVHIKTSSKSES